MKTLSCNLKCLRSHLKSLYLLTALALSAFLVCIPIPAHTEVNEQDILDAILGGRTFSNSELHEMDLNSDGAVDVADMVYFHQPIASFAGVESEIDETVGTHNVMIIFDKPVDCTLNYTVGGTASTTEPPDPPGEGDDYSALSGSVAVNGTNAVIQVSVNLDTIYEGDETIELNLLPSEDYLLGAERAHTITLKDNPFESSADYIFILSIETQGVEGDITEMKGFPSTLFSRTASINITFSQDSVLDAVLNLDKSIGFWDTTRTYIPLESFSYSDGAYKFVFTYSSESESFVSDPPLTSFSPEDPDLGVQNPKTLISTLILSLNDFDISTDKFTDKTVEGAFSLSVAGVLRGASTPSYEGSLLGRMQQ